MAKTKIHGEYLDPSVISTQTEVTAVGSDHMLIFDATDNALKKALLSDLIETVGSTPTFSQISSTGDLTIDAAGDIILDADGDDFKFQEGGTNIMSIKHESHGVDFLLSTTDEDFKFKGSDGGSTITALHLDMSAAGAATFNSKVTATELDVVNSSILDINLIGNPPELNLEDSGGTSGQKRARITVNSETLKIQGLSDDDTSITHEFISCDLSNGIVGINGVKVLADATNFTDSILISQNASTGTLNAATNNTGLGDTVFAALTSGDNNTSIGADSSKALTSGGSNVAVGFAALEANTTASHNTAIGFTALLSNTTGESNVAVGSQALDANTTGVNNVAIGRQALDNSTTGSRNVAVGTNALDASTTASSNTAVGDGAAKALTTGTGVVAIGAGAFEASNASAVVAVGTSAALSNTTGANFVAVGNNAARSNTEGVQFVAVGDDALYANTTGNYNHAFGQGVLDANTTGSNNTGVGAYALSANTTADHNTGIGYYALLSNTTGTTNTALGSLAGDAITTGSSNTALGVQALTALTTGSANVAVGKAAGENITTGSQNVILGGFNGNHQGLDVRTESDGKAIVSDGAGDIAFHNAVATAIYAGHVDVTGDSGSANAFALANGATVGLFGNNNNFSGVFILNDFTSTGEVAMFITGGGTISLVHQTGSNFSLTSSPASGKYGLYISGLAVKLVSNRGASASFRVCAFRTRNAQ